MAASSRGRAARLRQCRGRLWRQRQPAGRQRRLERRGRTRRGLYAAARASPMARSARPARRERCSAQCWPASTSPIRTSTRSSSASPPSIITSTRSAASAAPCGAPRGDGRAGLYRRPDARRGHGAHARPSRWRSRPAPACSIRNGTRAARSTATRACARSRRMSPTRWAGRRRPAQVAPWVYQQLTETFVLDPGDARAAGRAQPDRLGQDRQPADRSARAQLLDARPGDARERCAAPARNSKTGSKASAGVAA